MSVSNSPDSSERTDDTFATSVIHYTCTRTFAVLGWTCVYADVVCMCHAHHHNYSVTSACWLDYSIRLETTDGRYDTLLIVGFQAKTCLKRFTRKTWLSVYWSVRAHRWTPRSQCSPSWNKVSTRLASCASTFYQWYLKREMVFCNLSPLTFHIWHITRMWWPVLWPCIFRISCCTVGVPTCSSTCTCLLQSCLCYVFQNVAVVTRVSWRGCSKIWSYPRISCLHLNRCHVFITHTLQYQLNTRTADGVLQYSSPLPFFRLPRTGWMFFFS